MTFTWRFFTGGDSVGVFKHLLPRGKAWRLTIDKPLRRFFEGLSLALLDTTRQYIDLVWLDMFPETTRALDAWELQWGLPNTGLSEADRRTRLAGRWAAKGGQSPRYIQDTLQSEGFPVYIHDWWVPGSDPVEARNPFDVVEPPGIGCGEPLAQCGEPDMQCGESFDPETGYVLVNKIYTAEVQGVTGCGETLAQCGEDVMQCGNYEGFIYRRREYEIPTNPDTWPYFAYIGGETYGTNAVIPAERRDEFEDLCLKICPTHLWLALMVSYV